MNTTLNCTEVEPRVDELLHGELQPDEIAAFERHIRNCKDCAAALAEAEDLQIALLSMPVPELEPGFAAEALARARRRHVAMAPLAPASGTVAVAPSSTKRKPGPVPWWGPVAGAMAAGILLAALWGLRGDRPFPEEAPPRITSSDFRLKLHEPSEITIAIDAEQAMPGSRVTVRIKGGIALVGFGDTRELSWEADLEEGTNVLSLPVLAHSLEQGHLTAVVEHEARSRKIELTLQGEGTTPRSGSTGEQ